MTHSDTEFYKVMFESLYPGVYVHIGVLEAMMHVLNEEEKQWAPDSPFRLFLSPNMLLYQQKTKILDLPWKTRQNGEDCRVFCMRHMETYIGGGVKGWKCGLLHESDAQSRQLQQLRIKYLTKILTSTVNFLKDDIIVQAVEHDNLDPKKKQWPKTIKKMIKSRQSKFL
ncbi:hypothetical protein R6Q57_021487 [Mikania cordata]